MSAGVTVWRCEKEDRTCENAEVAQRELRGGSCEQRHARSAHGERAAPREVARDRGGVGRKSGGRELDKHFDGRASHEADIVAEAGRDALLERRELRRVHQAQIAECRQRRDAHITHVREGVTALGAFAAAINKDGLRV